MCKIVIKTEKKMLIGKHCRAHERDGRRRGGQHGDPGAI